MALRKVILKGDPLLGRRSREINEITGRIRTLAEDMWETMYEANGVGLAAPQVGVLRRLAVIDVTEPPDEEEEEPGGETENRTKVTPEPGVIKYVLINPEIIEVSQEMAQSKEGCLSVPGLVGIVERPKRVKVRAMGLDGEYFEVEGEGMLAKALFHEIDHLNGVLFTDIAESVEDVESPDE